ncbi:phosphoribosylaminoimidazole carboxylase [Salinibacter ruber]|jgi:hypothetical protein|uniref:phosphoribosylaminoimidazole carboxylase n=1 Tax=Salinibacter ruber TaxID=146919 RepID=UPI001617AAAA|nr:phosphoribosylaminoimidazole carboxylase [Salinibacter ruber]MBB4090107.1 uncharacterized membrane-anchored protein YitT (DUF2179 family) [Salinibacter ruber]MCS4201258.1 uncharacterized membrane-anchored protein YitT (DUF2179 family) [Salinibacter ruber]
MSNPDHSALRLHPASGALILGLDWLLFSENAVTLGLSTPFVAIIGLVVAGLGIGIVQRRYGGDGMGVAVLKGLLAGITVGIPLPVAGTAVGGGILALSGLNTGWRSPSEGPPPSSSRDGDS